MQHPLQQALQQQQLLRVLRLQYTEEEPALDLSMLTQLEELVAAIQPGGTVLPPQLKRLRAWNWKPIQDLSALTQLQDLTATVEPGQSVLPPQLQSLRVTNSVDGHILAVLTQLQQLRRLRLKVCFEEPQLLLCLKQLPGLQHLHLAYCEVQHAAGTAAAWAQLPQLKALKVTWSDEEEEDLPDEEELAVIWAGALACTGLTRLWLSAQNHWIDPDSVAVCFGLARLTGLQELTIGSITSLVPGDAWALTALTALTYLSLSGVL
uniref:Uncharacterized protein n=1 Tax=Tetradesmus obliquus TaxID=3088 RepID=A0A383W123_TETOB|eukprot:jgi/Sobl393_1/11805/SZX70366.1